jgi:hypothetical protein
MPTGSTYLLVARAAPDGPWWVLKRGKTREYVEPSHFAKRRWAELLVVEHVAVEDDLPLQRWVNGRKRPILHEPVRPDPEASS